MDWRHYLRFTVATTLFIGGAIYAFIVLLDPYQNIPFSPPLARAPVSTNQRFAYPALARDLQFDSLIIGTSTTRLLDPARITPGGAHFANLSMNSATAYEQAQLHKLFVHHHAGMKYLVIGIDETWCNRAQQIERYTFRAFPEWMYDNNAYNDLLYMFNDKALENAVRMLELLRGRRQAKYRLDGYSDFTTEFGPRDEGAIQKRLYEKDGKGALVQADVRAKIEHPARQYPLLNLLFEVIATTPAQTQIVLLFPPLHAHYIASREPNLSECKGHLALRAERDSRVRSLDYLYASDLTRADENFWDHLHFTSDVARVIEADIIAELSGRSPPSTDVRALPRMRLN